MKKKISLKTDELIILSYIDKFNTIDLYTLERELNAPLIHVVDTVNNLLKKQFIQVDDNSYSIATWILKKYKNIWDDFQNACRNNSTLKEDFFEWDYLYIPINFGEKYD